MKCTNCGAEFEDGTLFCPVCGAEVQWVAEYNTLETLIQQKKQEEEEKKRKEAEIRKEKERREKKAELERKKKKQKMARTAGGILAAVAVCAGCLFFLYQKQHNSFDFQLAQAETKFSNKDYENALKYVDRALSLKPDSSEAKILEAKICLKNEDESAALSILKSIVKTDPDNTSAYGELLRLYQKNEEYDRIKDLMDDAGEAMRSTYQEYICELPKVSKETGTYTEETEIEFSGLSEGTEVYYTLDGSVPNRDSMKYTEPIKLEEEETYTLKYIAYNAKSVPSDTGEARYVLSFEAPSAPRISPASDKYDYRTSIIVTAPAGCTVYYAFDETPTIESEVYRKPVSMKEGEHTFQAIAVDERGKISDVASRIYVYYGE